jgi:hypothetical protein
MMAHLACLALLGLDLVLGVEGPLAPGLGAEGSLALGLVEKGPLAPALAEDGPLAPALGDGGFLAPALVEEGSLDPTLGKEGSLAPSLREERLMAPILAPAMTLAPAIVKEGPLAPAVVKEGSPAPVLVEEVSPALVLVEERPLAPALVKEGPLAPTLAEERPLAPVEGVDEVSTELGQKEEVVTAQHGGLVVVGTVGRALEVRGTPVQRSVDTAERRRSPRPGSTSACRRARPSGGTSPSRSTGWRAATGGSYSSTAARRSCSPLLCNAMQVVPSYHNDVFRFYAHTSFRDGEDGVLCPAGPCRLRSAHYHSVTVQTFGYI